MGEPCFQSVSVSTPKNHCLISSGVVIACQTSSTGASIATAGRADVGLHTPPYSAPAGGKHQLASSSSSRSRKPSCPEGSRLASSSPNHPARSTSGNSWVRPDRGGHSISKELLCTSLTSRSPSIAHAHDLPARLSARRAGRVRSRSAGPVRSPPRTRGAPRRAGPRRIRTRLSARTRRPRPSSPRTGRPGGRGGPRGRRRPAVREESGAELRHARRLSWPTARGSPGPSRSCRHRRPACRAGSLTRAKRSAGPPG